MSTFGCNEGCDEHDHVRAFLEMELGEIESRNAAEEARISDLRATIRRFRGTDLFTLCHDCKRRKILAVLSLIRGEEERMSDENKGEMGAAGGGAGAR